MVCKTNKGQLRKNCFGAGTSTGKTWMERMKPDFMKKKKPKKKSKKK